jgi:SNF2 family DNA or RNA helicase
MARLFGKEFHEHSNSWYFKSKISSFEKGDLSFRKYLDENGNVVFKFEVSDKESKLFTPKVEIVYDKINREILSHYCSEDGQEICRHYLSIINYAYKYYSTGILDTDVIQTYQTRLLEYNEYWQRIVLNAKIEIGDIFNEKNNKIRFYFRNYAPMNIRLISILSADKEYKEEDKSDIEQARKQAKALSELELELLILLQNQKCSFSRKGFFFTVYKSKLIKFFPILRSLSHKIFIKETGDKIKFPDEEFRINFQVNKYKDDLYKLEVSAGEQISATFVGRTTYFFKQNNIYSLNLPFDQKITKQVFSEGYIIKKTDLVYLSSIVARQLGLIKCYIDFAEDIEFPEVYHNTPIITFNLHKEKNKIVMKGLLDYSHDLTIPMSVVRFSTELVRYDQDEEISWFYIPPQTKYQIFDFVQKLPDSQKQRLEEKSQLVFEGEENIEALKKIIFEQANPEWNIILSEELKKEFVYKVNLQPLIRAKKTNQINWFEYEIEYKFKDISFTHRELKKFFNTKEKFLKLDDGRLLFFENKIAFQKVDDLLKKSEKLSSNAYKLYVYNIPYVYQLSSIQSGIKIFGDNYLEEMFSSILKRKLRKNPPVPKFLQPVMRTYQKKGFHWLKMLQHYGLSGILADDMGLGKTIQAISILSDLPSNVLSIVICPKTLLFNWAVEIEKFNRNLSFIIYEGNQKERRNILDNLNVDVLLASYSIIQNDIEYLSEIDFEYIILDEAQHIKNAEALRTQAVKKLKSKHKMVLSGTPIENNPSELWSIFDFLMPGYLPSLRRFKNEFMVSSDVNKETQTKLKALISPFILRRKKKDVLIELPDKQEQISYCKMIPIQEKMYLQVIEKVKKNILIKFDDSGQNFIHVLAALMKLRQICDHPFLINKSIHQRVEFSGKTELLREIIVDAVENDKKILIFSQFVKMLQILRKMLKELKIAFEYMDGSTKNRQKVIDNFNNNNSIRAFLISLKTGGFGVNLTAADTVIIVDPWWNPMGETQAIDRAHRIGQTKKVMVYKIITKGSIEEKILDLQQNKREMFENLIEEGQSVFKKLTSEQLRNLFEY